MLSYMLPVEEKSPPSRNLNLHLNGNLNSECDEQQQQQQQQQLRTMPSSTITTGSTITTPSTKLINFERNNGNNNNNINSVLKSSDITSVKRTLNDLKFDNNNIINNNFIENNNSNFNDINNINNNNNNVINNINNNSNLIGNNVGNSGGGGGGGGGGILTTSSSDDSKKLKMSKIGNSKVTLKRVSFGSSKGSMVETLVFETPTPLPEHAEREFGFSLNNINNNNNNDMGYTMASQFPTTSQTLPATQLLPTTTTTITNNKLYYTNLLNNNNNNLINNSYLDDSGIEMQEELERSKVRVTFFQSGKPQQVSSPPENHLGFFDIDSSTFPNDYHNNINNNNNINNHHLDSNLISTANMTATTAIIPPAAYDRQMSTESGWDNPFRPGGDLSREADEIVNMIKGGKPITPTGDGNLNLSNGAPQMNHSAENGMAVVDGATKVEVSQVQSQPNGTKSPQKPITDKKNGDTTIPHQQQQPQQPQQQKQHQPQTQISNQVIPGPQSASHVVLDDKKKKKCACCVIQ